jgi:hypothetical protein
MPPAFPVSPPFPVVRFILPVCVDADAPVRTLIKPLAPTTPAVAVEIFTSPLAPSSDVPESSHAEPPTNFPFPAVSVTSPPGDDVVFLSAVVVPPSKSIPPALASPPAVPDMITTAPPVPLVVDAPAVTMTEPEVVPVTALVAPVERRRFPLALDAFAPAVRTDMAPLLVAWLVPLLICTTPPPLPEEEPATTVTFAPLTSSP